MGNSEPIPLILNLNKYAYTYNNLKILRSYVN